MSDANPVKTPLEPGVRLIKRDCPATPNPALHSEYHAIVCHLSFLVTMTRPDLAFAFAELSKFVQCPGVKHIETARRMLAYLAGTQELGVMYSEPDYPADLHCLHSWVDSDYAADPDNHHSTSGYLVSMNNSLVSWKAKRQLCTTLSLAEAEFVVASVCWQEMIYLRNLLRDLGFAQTLQMLIFEDNTSCILM